MISRCVLIFGLFISTAHAHDFERELAVLGLTDSDLTLPTGFSLPHTIQSVEQFFKKPLTMPATASLWLDQTDNAKTSAQLLNVAIEILGSVIASEAKQSAVAKRTRQIASVAEKRSFAMTGLFEAIDKAQTLVNRATSSITVDQRNGFLHLMEWTADPDAPLEQEISSRRIKAKYAGMNDYRLEDMLEAGQLLTEAIDDLLPTLHDLPNIKTKTKRGNILWGGRGDDIYTEADLKDINLLIDLGGFNIYEGAAAAAGPGEIRIVIDLGNDIEVRGPVARGIFGVGLFYAPTPNGTKQFYYQSFSQGCGFGGIGGLFASGESHFLGDRNVQGAAAFGVGLCVIRSATRSSLTANRNAQGLGWTRGVGLLRLEGDDIQIRGGLVQPDPREPQGAVSLCQGVGFGHRAYSGGGVGLASLSGNGINVKGSYFAQGCGYWHALGGFRLTGNNSTLQARRYDQGTGVHYAYGHFEVKGHNNRILNWGVGPAYGWDRSYGSALIEGHENEIQADWGTGTASIGSLSSSRIIGERNKLKIPDFGSGSFAHNELGFSFHVVKGSGTVWESPLIPALPLNKERLLPNSWGTVTFEDVRFEKNLKLAAPTWDALPQEPMRQRNMIDLQAVIHSAQGKPALEKTADLIDVASAFSIDKESPRQALEQLLSLPKEALPALVDQLDPAAVEQLIRLRVILPAYGDQMGHILLDRFDEAPIEKQVLFINQLGLQAPSLAFPKLLSLLSHEKLRLSALRTLGAMLNKDTGVEPGIRAVLIKPERGLIARLRLPEAHALLAMLTDFDQQSRLAFQKQSPADITETIGEKGAKKFLRQLRKEKIPRELAALEKAEQDVRSEIFTLLKSTGTAELAMALVVLGQIAHPDDAHLAEPFLAHPKAPVRQAAVIALARFGDAGLPYLMKALSSPSVQMRSLVMTSLPHAVTKKAALLFYRGVDDVDPLVRQYTLAAYRSLPPVLEPQRKKMEKTLVRKSIFPSRARAAKTR